MKILITGANGFVGKNLIAELRNKGYVDLLLCDRTTSESDLKKFSREAEFVYHLAGVNRPKEQNEFNTINTGFTEKLLDLLSVNTNVPPVMFASSTQADLVNPYGESKKKAEALVRSYGEKNLTKVFIYRFPNLFGKWSKPNYNSVIATFSHNIARNIPIKVNDEKTELKVAYIDDVIKQLISLLDENHNNDTELYYDIAPTYQITLGEIVNLLTSFKESRSNLSVVQLDNPLVKKMYSTYLSYLPENDFSYKLIMHSDDRGSFSEFIRTPDRGQISVNISKPGITKGNHWHHTKNEKFLVVSGKGVIRFRKFDSNDIIEYFVNDQELEVVDIPVGYTHNIENLGETDMVTLMWVNEPFDKTNPDTYYMEV